MANMDSGRGIESPKTSGEKLPDQVNQKKRVFHLGPH